MITRKRSPFRAIRTRGKDKLKRFARHQHFFFFFSNDLETKTPCLWKRITNKGGGFFWLDLLISLLDQRREREKEKKKKKKKKGDALSAIDLTRGALSLDWGGAIDGFFFFFFWRPALHSPFRPRSLGLRTISKISIWVYAGLLLLPSTRIC